MGHVFPSGFAVIQFSTQANIDSSIVIVSQAKVLATIYHDMRIIRIRRHPPVMAVRAPEKVGIDGYIPRRQDADIVAVGFEIVARDKGLSAGDQFDSIPLIRFEDTTGNTVRVGTPATTVRANDQTMLMISAKNTVHEPQGIAVVLGDEAHFVAAKDAIGKIQLPGRNDMDSHFLSVNFEASK